MSQKTILITGATDGIGLALAQYYAQRAAFQPTRLVLVGRRSLEELYAAGLPPQLFTPITYLQTDLAQDDGVQKIRNWLQYFNINQIDLLINNAAMGYIGPAEVQTPEHIEQLVNVNLHTPIALTHALMPFVEQVQGKIVYISSVASIYPAPDYATYVATKAALEGFVRNLRIELKAAKRKVSVQLIRPGATRTGIHSKSGATPAHISQKQWENFDSAVNVATDIAKAIPKRQTFVTIGAKNQWSYRVAQLFEGFLAWGMTRMRKFRKSREPLPLSLPEKSTQTVPAQVAPAEPHPAQMIPGQQPAKPTQAKSTQAKTFHCLITGAANGIGKSLAAVYGTNGYLITGVDSDRTNAMYTQSELHQADVRIRFALIDLGKTSEMDRLVEMLSDRPPIDVLIHNAGISSLGHFADSNLQRQQAVLNVNFRAPMQLTAKLLQTQNLAYGAQIVCISSLSHFVGYPGAAVYAASKDGLHTYAKNLSLALTDYNIGVTTVYPGPTNTDHARKYSPDNRNEEKRMIPGVLARQILLAANRRQRVLIPGTNNKVYAAAGKYFPGITEFTMKRAILDKLDKPAPTSEQPLLNAPQQ